MFIMVGFAGLGQNLKGYNVTATYNLETKDNIIISGDTLNSTTKVSLNDTTLLTKLYAIDSLPFVKNPTDSIQFNNDVTGLQYKEGKLFYDYKKGNLITHNMYSDVSGDIMKEQWVDVVNKSGSTILNGSVVYVDTANIISFRGTSMAFPTIKLAKADKPETVRGILGVVTHDIPNDSTGLVTTTGTVNGINTTGLVAGRPVYVSGTTAGGLIGTRPEYPYFVIEVGTCLTSSVGIGNVYVNKIGRVDDIGDNFLNSLVVESFDFNVTSNGSTVTGSLTKTGGGDNLTLRYSTGYQTLSVNPAKTVTLIAGTDSNPQLQYVYIPISTKVLTVSISGYPTNEEFIPIAKIGLRSAATTQSEGAIRNQNINNHLAATTGQGHMVEMGERIRKLNAEWENGVVPTMTIQTASNPDNVYFSSTDGNVYQMHKQSFPAFNMATGSSIHVVNHPTSPFLTITNLNTQLTDATGATMASKTFTFVIWGVANKGGTTSHLMLNLPTGAANNATEAQQKAVYSIPNDFKGVGFLIARYTFSHSPSGSGSWTLESSQDLRGYYPNQTAGSGVGISGYTNFVQLLDTPNSYTGFAGYPTKVNSLATGLEFSLIDTITNNINRANFQTMIDKNVTVSGKQNQLNGTGFVKATGTAISYDNTVYKSDNANLSSVNWTVKDATLSTHAMSYGQFTSAVSGTTTYIPKFTGINSIGNSQIFDNGTSIGIGTTLTSVYNNRPPKMLIRYDSDVTTISGSSAVPAVLSIANMSTVNDAMSRLEFVGRNVSATMISSAFISAQFKSHTGNGITTDLLFGTSNQSTEIGGQEKMRLTNSGNLLVGSATDNLINKLQVNGSAIINIGGSNANPSLTIGRYGGHPSIRNESGSIFILDGYDGVRINNYNTTSISIGNGGGNTLIGTATDNGIDKLQVNGTTSGSPATLSNQYVTKAQLDASAITNHATLTNLDYSNAGHTGFVSTETSQTISGAKTFTGKNTTSYSLSTNYIHEINNTNSLGYGALIQTSAIGTQPILTVQSYATSDQFRVNANGTIKMTSIPNETKSYIVGYDPTSKYISYQAAPLTYTASNGIDLTGSNFSLNVDNLSLMGAASVVDGDFMILYDTSMGSEFKLSMGGLKTYIGTLSGGTIETFTTTGTSGVATYSGNTLNIPNYTSGWSLVTGGISTTNSTDEVRIGNVDYGDYKLSVNGDSFIAGNLNVTGNIDGAIISASSSAYAPFFNMSNSFIATTAIAHPTVTTNNARIYKFTNNKLYYAANTGTFDLTGTEMPLKTIVSSTTLTVNDYTIMIGSGGSISSYGTQVSGKIFVIRNKNSGSISIPSYIPTGTATASTTIAGYAGIMIQYDGTTWYQIK